MRRLALFALAATAALPSCAPQPLQLSDEPVERATTCTAVRALELHQGIVGQRPVSFEGFTEILHFGMVAAARDSVDVDLRRLLTISQRAPVAMEELAGQNWRSLVEPCNAAFPETQRPAPALAGEAFEAGMTCFGISDFIARTAADFPDEQKRFAALSERALAAAQPVLRERARDEADAARIVQGYRARAFLSGTPVSLLTQCGKRFAAAPPAG